MGLGRQYDDLVEVREDEGEPSQFLWHGRLHQVRAVLGHWRARTPWWRDVEHLVLEAEVWRVEAGAGARWGTGVYDLVRLPAPAESPRPATWRLARVGD